MRSFKDFGNIYLHSGPVDFRKGINGLSLIVENVLELPAFEAQSLFVFTNKPKNKLTYLDMIDR